MVGVPLQAEHGQERCNVFVIGLGCRKPDVVAQIAPGQQARLLEDHAESPVGRLHDVAAIIAIQPCDHPQESRLAATRRADDDADFASIERKREILQDLDVLSG